MKNSMKIKLKLLQYDGYLTINSVWCVLLNKTNYFKYEICTVNDCMLKPYLMSAKFSLFKHKNDYPLFVLLLFFFAFRVRH